MGGGIASVAVAMVDQFGCTVSGVSLGDAGLGDVVSLLLLMVEFYRRLSERVMQLSRDMQK